VKRGLCVLILAVCTGCALPGADGQCDAAASDPFRELLVVDPAVLAPSAAAPADLPWSPPAVLRATGSGTWLARGLARWRDAARSEGNAAVADALDTFVLCRWLRETPGNGCDESCADCGARVYDEAHAPFRTLAVVNRTDLRLMPDARSQAGEGRVVLGLAPEPGAEAPAFGLTLIFEYALEGSAESWAKRWHALAPLGDGDASRALADLVQGFVTSSPLSQGGPALSQLRTSIELDAGSSELRQLAPDADGELCLHALRNTPRAELDGSQTLDAWVREQTARILDGSELVPAEMLAEQQAYGAHDWSLPEVEPDVRSEFDRGTCAGCHAHAGVDGGFQLSPFVLGRAGVSPFLFNPSADDDELRRRTREQRAVRCPNPQASP
jgi:hypothetical protein